MISQSRSVALVLSLINGGVLSHSATVCDMYQVVGDRPGAAQDASEVYVDMLLRELAATTRDWDPTPCRVSISHGIKSQLLVTLGGGDVDWSIDL